MGPTRTTGRGPCPPSAPRTRASSSSGLAPGLHGANRTGRPFTGDYAGELLYRTLYEAGLATRPESLAADDGLG